MLDIKIKNRIINAKREQIAAAKQSGMALVMALLILTVVMISVLALSKLITEGVEMSLNVDNSVAAFYAAETGVEKALYRLKFSRSEGDFVYFTKLKDPVDPVPIGDDQASAFDVTDNTDIKSLDFIVNNLATSSPAHVNIVDPAGDISSIDWYATPGANMGYEIAWQIDNCFPSHASDRLEVTLNYFEQNFTNQGANKLVGICNCAYGDNNCDDIISSVLEDDRYYSISLRPLDDSIKWLSFWVTANGSPTDILSEVNIEVDGSYHGSVYRLKVRLPSITPTSDVFSYVIFSEEDLIKDS